VVAAALAPPDAAPAAPLTGEILVTQTDDVWRDGPVHRRKVRLHECELAGDQLRAGVERVRLGGEDEEVEQSLVE
jgi:hypothetical protein